MRGLAVLGQSSFYPANPSTGTHKNGLSTIWISGMIDSHRCYKSSGALTTCGAPASVTTRHNLHSTIILRTMPPTLTTSTVSRSASMWCSFYLTASLPLSYAIASSKSFDDVRLHYDWEDLSRMHIHIIQVPPYILATAPLRYLFRICQRYRHQTCQLCQNQW